MPSPEPGPVESSSTVSYLRVSMVKLTATVSANTVSLPAILLQDAPSLLALLSLCRPNPVLDSFQQNMATHQQMQVVIPEGVSPGMPFQVITPSGPMQVVCPPGAAAGSPIMVSVPVVAQAVAQPMVVAAQSMEEPIMMGTALDASQGATMVGSAPAPQSMSMQRSEMDGRMNEVASGCYGLKSLPCCYITYARVSPEHVSVGPCCCCFGLCICPCPGCCGDFRPIAPGSASFKEPFDGTTWTFTSPTTFVANGGMGGSKNEPYVRYC